MIQCATIRIVETAVAARMADGVAIEHVAET
jgi:hypothetical protein